ncbi:MAG: hypothetical protein E6Q36_09840 [Chryseobacterium sp.]|nr:MAG: hypothetical protein E6Q36_09840 [Chryseobacterium sp.]
MSTGGKTQTTTNQTIIPEEVKPLLSQYLNQAQTLSQQPGSNPMMQYGANDMWGQTANAYGGIDAARQGLLGVTQQTPGQNPYLDQVINKSMGDITRNYQEAIAPGTNANFARAGAFGGSAWQQANERNQRGLGEALGNTANQMRYQDYGDTQSRQMQAYGLLPSISSAGQGVAQNLYGMGQNVQNQAANQLGILGQAVGVGMGGAGQSTTGANPNYRSPLQTALGLGALFL